MSYRQLLRTCRFLTAVLLFNMAIPLLAQANSNSSYILMCTSAGLTKVKVANVSDINGLINNAIVADRDINTETLDGSLEHCVYCNLIDKPVFYPALQTTHLINKNTNSVTYQLDKKQFLPKSLLRYVQLRAPPFHI